MEFEISLENVTIYRQISEYDTPVQFVGTNVL